MAINASNHVKTLMRFWNMSRALGKDDLTTRQAQSFTIALAGPEPSRDCAARRLMIDPSYITHFDTADAAKNAVRR